MLFLNISSHKLKLCLNPLSCALIGWKELRGGRGRWCTGIQHLGEKWAGLGGAPHNITNGSTNRSGRDPSISSVIGWNACQSGARGGRGVVWTAARVLWFSVRRQSCHSSEGRLFSARRSGITNRLTKKQLATTNSSAFFTAFLLLCCPLRHNDACFLFTLEDAKGKQ